ncbi:MAG: ABC transporter permease [Chloroflexi bacterium]|nr:ABC transporter permease [Chloroflexota bacterium]
MQRYIIRRLLIFVPVLWGISLMIFLILRILPGDIAEMLIVGSGSIGLSTQADIDRLREQMGLNRPLPAQYVDWIGGVARLDAGKSLKTGRPVVEEIGRRVPVTLELAVLSVAFSIFLSIPIGVLSALRQDTWLDYLVRVVAIGGVALPIIWTGTLMVLFLVVFFDWMPPLGFANAWDDPGKNLQQVFWPALVLGYYFAAVVARMTRSQMLEVLRQDYIRTAWAKGLRERIVVMRHALKNAMLPVVTVIGLQFGALMGGAVIVEKIFVLPGIGSNLVESIGFRDYPMVQTTILFIAAAFAFINLIVDVLYAWLDPKIRYT